MSIECAHGSFSDPMDCQPCVNGRLLNVLERIAAALEDQGPSIEEMEIAQRKLARAIAEEQAAAATIASIRRDEARRSVSQ